MESVGVCWKKREGGREGGMERGREGWIGGRERQGWEGEMEGEEQCAMNCLIQERCADRLMISKV